MTMQSQDISRVLQQAVTDAAGRGQPLQLQGSGSKAFLAPTASGQPLDLTGHRGVVNYEPRELVITLRAGTPLNELETLLAAEGQMLPFEPPHFGPNATLGGSVACGLSGPRRPYTGALRDFVLGTTLVNGRGQILRFGGEVMKNVAGYDVSRLMVGAMGTLGLLLDVSMKVLPRPEQECTLVQELEPGQAIERANRLAATPLPISGACYDGLRLHLRLSGSEQGVAAARRSLGGEQLAADEAFWSQLKEQDHPFFDSASALWRLSVPATTAPLELPGKQLIDWGGALRWLISDAAPDLIVEAAARQGGHARLFRGGDSQPQASVLLAEPVIKLQRQLKQAFDPKAILNPGRLFTEI